MSIELVSEFINVSTNWNVADEKKLIQTFSATPKLDDDRFVFSPISIIFCLKNL